jgi:hypothetical protein
MMTEKKNTNMTLKNSQEMNTSETDSNHISHRKKLSTKKQQLKSLENLENEDYGGTTSQISVIETSK